MILQTYRLSLIELKAACSTTVYKNLSLTMRIQNRTYPIIGQTRLFNGQVTIKLRQLDNVDFEFDTERNKYLPKQIQLQLKLVYRTGKINQKLYQVNFNEFVTSKSGVKQKMIKVTQRLYSLQLVIVARSAGLDSPFSPRQISSMNRIKSEQRFDKLGSGDENMRKSRYSKCHSPSELIKCTIEENIKITRHQKTNHNTSLQLQHAHQYHQLSILKENFMPQSLQGLQNEESRIDESSSFIQRNKVFTSRSKPPIQTLSRYPVKAINTIVTAISQRVKTQKLEYTIEQLQSQFQQQKQRCYILQKQLSNVKNKLEHVYHQKCQLIKQKAQEREVFESKDKDEKIRQRRDIEHLRRHFQGIIKQKDAEISKLSLEIQQIHKIVSDYQNKVSQVQKRALDTSTKLNARVIYLEQLLAEKDHQIIIKEKESKVARDQRDFAKNDVRTLLLKINRFQNQPQTHPLQNTKTSSSIRTSNLSLHTQKTFLQDNYQHSLQHSSTPQEQLTQLIKQEQLLQLVEDQARTYHEMIARLEEKIRRLEKEIQIRDNSRSVQVLYKKPLELLESNRAQELQKKVQSLQQELERYKILNQQQYQFESTTNNPSKVKRSYSVGMRNMYEPQTIKIKTTSQTRLTYRPSCYQMVYVPPIVASKQYHFQANNSVNYGTHYNEYRQDHPSVSVNYNNHPTGYFGRPVPIYTSPEKNSIQQLLTREEQLAFDDCERNDSLLVEYSEGSYINEDGDYVKRTTKTVWQRNQ